MMNNRFLHTPVRILRTDSMLFLDRPLLNSVDVLDNLVELVVYTPRGSFSADPDFGFEYWNHEYSNVHFRDFNNGQKASNTHVTRQACEDSIKDTLAAYAPRLKHVNVSMELNALTSTRRSTRRNPSRYEVSVFVSGELDDGLGTSRPYNKNVRFLMEPVAKAEGI